MKQLIQHLKSGETELKEVAVPVAGPGQLLVRTRCSLVSLGTERMLVEFGRANFLAKVRQQPERVQQVLHKMKAEGVLPTLEAVFRKLGQPLPLGYCNAGEVAGIGEGVEGFSLGDRVASNGGHAEYVCVPETLAAKIPDGVSDEDAAFTVVGAIALQSIRLAELELGETVVVIGLGLVGQLTAQLAAATGCRVVGVDIDPVKLEFAKPYLAATVNSGESDPVKAVMGLTAGLGADAVLVAASAKTDSIMSQAAQMSRQRGRLILLGVVGLNLNRADFYEKELRFQVSCSYGPGRYDFTYEEKGVDYPFGLVRWTAKRNFEAVLQAVAGKKVSFDTLVSRRLPFEEFATIYNDMADGSIANLLLYHTQPEAEVPSLPTTHGFKGFGDAIALVGAGNFVKMTMMPYLKKAPIKWVISAGGLNASLLAEEYKIPASSAKFADALGDNEVKSVIIATRHREHAPMVVEALKAGKNVFVEKPLALNEVELQSIAEAYKGSGCSLTVGFNRRHAPLIQQIRRHLPPQAKKNLIFTVNAGFIPTGSWVHDPEVGGGRLIGEGCHFIDLLAYLSGSPVAAVCSQALGEARIDADNVTILLQFENGDRGTVHYFANGHKSASKERLDVYWEGKIFQMENFRELVGYGVPGFSKAKSSLDKGHAKQFEMFVERSALGGEAITDFRSVVNSTRASFAAVESLKTRGWVEVQ